MIDLRLLQVGDEAHPTLKEGLQMGFQVDALAQRPADMAAAISPSHVRATGASAATTRERRCPDCGFGALVARPLRRCPMCGGSDGRLRRALPASAAADVVRS